MGKIKKKNVKDKQIRDPVNKIKYYIQNIHSKKKKNTKKKTRKKKKQLLGSNQLPHQCFHSRDLNQGRKKTDKSS